jgi:hypothetical protein
MTPMLDWGSMVLVSAAFVGSLLGMIYFCLSVTGNTPTNQRQDT